MATCPRCLGPLTDGHRCPRGRSRHGLTSVSLMAAGATTGATACYGLIDHPHGFVVLASALLGGMLARALREAINPGA
jgi:hypothetical protein